MIGLLGDLRERTARIEEKVSSLKELEGRVSVLENKQARAAGRMAGLAAVFSLVEPFIKNKLGISFLP